MSRKHGHSPVELQFAIKYAMPKNRKFRMTQAVLMEAINWWLENDGEAPDGFEITPVAWVHSGQVKEADAEDPAFISVLRRLLQGGATVSFKIWSAQAI